MSKIGTKLVNMHTALMMGMAGVDMGNDADGSEPRKENGDHLIEVLGVILIAVILLVFFRQKLVDMFKGATNNVTNSINNLFNAVS